MLRTCIILGVVAKVASAGMTWCFSPPLEDSLVAKRAGAEFRGSFRDLSLWLESGVAHDACEQFDRHVSQNDGLWIVEFDDEAQMLTERRRMAGIAGIEVKVVRNRTIVVGGGEEAAEKLGYDACGSEEGKRFISVPTQNVRGPRAMPKAAKARYASLLIEPQPLNVALLDAIDQDQLIETIAHLESYTSRNSYSGSNGLDDAVEWAEGRFRSLGFETSRLAFRDDMTPEVIATLRGTEDPEKIVVVGAHLDSRGTLVNSATQRAPGADDNGSGSASVLELARIINATGATFKHTLQLCLFTGEEQGLVGSRALAKKMADEGQDVVAMFNADMIGYAPQGADIVLSYVNRYADLDLTEVSRQVTQTYVPEVQTAFTESCCSDQQSFFENGFPSVGFFETPEPRVIYPQYHTSNDLLENLSSEKIYLMTKATLASAIVLAEPLSVVL